MAEFDEIAYDAAHTLFNEAKRIRRSLPSLIDQVNDSLDLLTAANVAGDKVTGGGNGTEERTIDAIEKHGDLLAKLHDDEAHYRDVARKCESAIADMESHLEGDALDSALLRYYYMQDMSVPKLMGKVKHEGRYYSEQWLYEKKDIALVRVSAAVRRLGYL